MTAQIIRLYRDMPEQLSRAELDAATDAHVEQLRARECLIEVQEMRHKRPSLQQAQAWRIRDVLGIVALLALLVVYEWAVSQ